MIAKRILSKILTTKEFMTQHIIMTVHKEKKYLQSPYFQPMRNDSKQEVKTSSLSMFQPMRNNSKQEVRTLEGTPNPVMGT